MSTTERESIDIKAEMERIRAEAERQRKER